MQHNECIDYVSFMLIINDVKFALRHLSSVG